MTAKQAMLLLGRCIRAHKESGVEVVVTMRELDKNLKMFFPEKYTFFAYDAKEECKPGDIVLLKKRDEPLTRKITHDISKVVYPFGDVTDPLTGKKVVRGSYREHMEEIDLTFNQSEGGFSKYLMKKREQAKQPAPPPKPAPSFVRRSQRNFEKNNDETQ